jgi:hypothetical protein
MSAAATDKFLKTGLPGTAASLAAPGYTIGDSSITISSTTDWPTDTGVIFGIDVAEIVNGQEVRMDGSYCVFSGVVTSGTVISNLSLEFGTPQNYAAGALTRVYITISTIHNERLINGILAEHKQTGAHSNVHADTVTVTGVTTLDDVVIGGNLTIAGNTDAAGWSPLGATPNTVTYNGNGSYSLVFTTTDLTSTVSNGMRLKTTRTVSAPTQCTSLNGTTQYYSKSSPAGMTFTDDFVVGGWYKPSVYAAATGVMASRYNGTSGWQLIYEATGQITLAGYNAGSANFSYIRTYQSIPLSKWTHVAAQLDMSTFTATTTTSYIMINGVDVPCSVGRAGTNPIALVQAGNLEIGSGSGGLLPFPGKIAQTFIFNAKVTQATMRGYISQTLSGSETSLISAYSFNNSINDLSANANNLSANGSAVATNADSPFTQDDTNTPTGTTDVAILMKKTFSTDTTLVVQVAEGCTIPTSGGVSSMSYSVDKAPYGFPARDSRWAVETIFKSPLSKSSPSASTWYNLTGTSTGDIMMPIGAWRLSLRGTIQGVKAANAVDVLIALSSGASSASNDLLIANFETGSSPATGYANVSDAFNITAGATGYYLNIATTYASVTTLQTVITSLRGALILRADNAYV